MFRKLLLSVLLLIPAIGSAQGLQYLDVGVTTTAHIWIVTTANAPMTSTTTAATIQFDVTKADGTNSTFFCTASGGNNDCISEVHTMRVELTSAQLNTVGPTWVSWSGSCCLPGVAALFVNHASGLDCFRDGDCATLDSIWEYALTSIGDVGSVGTLIESKLTYVTQMAYGVAFTNFPIWMKNSTGAGVAGLTDITCKVSQDGAAAATSNDTSEAEVDAGDNPGLYVIDLATGETDVTIAYITCVTAGATALQYDTFYTPQR